jgi:hypothetical protein
MAIRFISVVLTASQNVVPPKCGGFFPDAVVILTLRPARYRRGAKFSRRS